MNTEQTEYRFTHNARISENHVSLDGFGTKSGAVYMTRRLTETPEACLARGLRERNIPESAVTVVSDYRSEV